MSLLGIELTVLEQVVILNDGTDVGVLEQLVTVVHLYAERLERMDNLGGVSYDSVGFIGHLGQEMLDDGRVDAELHHLGVNHDKLELCRMLLVEQGCDDAVETYGLTLTGGAGYKQVRHLGQIKHEHLIGYGASKSHGKLHLAFGKLTAVQYGLHRYHYGLGVRYFYTDGSLAGYGCYDTYAQGGQTQCYVSFKVTDL